MSLRCEEDQIFAIDPGEMNRLPLPFAQQPVLISEAD
jgi:hypothetical protein